MRKLICILLACALLFCLPACRPEPEPVEPTEPVEPAPAPEPEPEPEPEPPAADNAIVSQSGEDKLTNQLLNYYYWLGFGNFYEVYASSFEISPEKSLAEQEYREGISWQKYFTDYAVELWQAMVVFKHAAEDAGYVMSDEYLQRFEGFRAELEESASNSGCEDVEKYLDRTYGELADYDSYYSFYYDYYYAMSYYYSVYDELYAARQEAGDTVNLVTVRHVLISPTNTSSDADWDSAERLAGELYDLWQQNGGESDYLISLAEEHSTDLNTRYSGGLYEDMEPGRLPAGFDDWCFDPARQPGDSAVVPSAYGYHIVSFISTGAPFEGDAAAYLADKDHAAWADARFAEFSFTTNIENAEIFVDFG